MNLLEHVKSMLSKVHVEQGEIYLEEPISQEIIQNNAEIAKDLIARRYQRLNTPRRRPSLEYLTSDNILQIFLNFVGDKELILKLNSFELQDLYNVWYENVYIKSR